MQKNQWDLCLKVYAGRFFGSVDVHSQFKVLRHYVRNVVLELGPSGPNAGRDGCHKPVETDPIRTEPSTRRDPQVLKDDNECDPSCLLKIYPPPCLGQW